MDSDALYESDGDSVCESDNAEYSEPSWSSLGDGKSRDHQNILEFSLACKNNALPKILGEIVF